jgi:polyhydroxyalkanoate synthesis regulator phasin
MNNLHASEAESKKYTDDLIESIKEKLEFLDRVNKQIQDLQQAF